MGVYFSVIREGYPPKPQFSVDDIPDLSGKVALVTGATSGVYGFILINAREA
jgi:hypothetical protein